MLQPQLRIQRCLQHVLYEPHREQQNALWTTILKIRINSKFESICPSTTTVSTIPNVDACYATANGYAKAYHELFRTSMDSKVQ
jgi:tetrahydromethanopterin S-methyltransferase subunit B